MKARRAARARERTRFQDVGWDRSKQAERPFRRAAGSGGRAWAGGLGPPVARRAGLGARWLGGRARAGGLGQAGRAGGRAIGYLVPFGWNHLELRVGGMVGRSRHGGPARSRNRARTGRVARHHRRMPGRVALPASFRAYLVDKPSGVFTRGLHDPRTRRPAAGRGRDRGRVVGRQLQGRAGRARGRQGRPFLPARPGDRPRGPRAGVRGPCDPARRRRARPRVRHRHVAPWRVRARSRACRPAGWCRCPTG